MNTGIRSAKGGVRVPRPTDEKLLKAVLRSISLAVRKEPVRKAPRDKERWYARSYVVFAGNEPGKHTPEGLVRVLAFAASWLPTIPDACPTTRQDDVDDLVSAFEALSALESAHPDERRVARARILDIARRWSISM